MHKTLESITCHSCGVVELKESAFCSDATLEQYVCSNCHDEHYTEYTSTSIKDTLERLKKIQENDLNILTCGDCGLVHIIDFDNELIKCSKCGFIGAHCDYPDLLSECDLYHRCWDR